MASDQFEAMAKAAGDSAKGTIDLAGGSDGVASTIMGGANDILKGALESKFVDPALARLNDSGQRI